MGLRVDYRSPLRPPSRSEPSPNSLKADCEVGHKAATADSPTTSRRGTNDEASFTELQTSALGKLAKLAGVRAEETFAGASTAHMLEKAVDDAEENEHVRLQPPTPAPAYGGDYVASPAPERPDPIAAIGTDPSPESTSSYRYGPMSQGPTPPPPQSYPYGPLSASSSSSAYSPYSAYPYETTLQPQQPQQAYPYGYAPAPFYYHPPPLTIDQMVTRTPPAGGYVVGADSRLSSPVPPQSPVMQSADGTFYAVSPSQPNQYLQQQAGMYYYPAQQQQSEDHHHHSREPSNAPEQAAPAHPSSYYPQHSYPSPQQQHMAYYGMPASGGFPQPYYSAQPPVSPIYPSQQYEQARRALGASQGSTATAMHGHGQGGAPPELSRGHLAQSRLHDAAYNRPPPMRQPGGGPRTGGGHSGPARSALPRPPPHSEFALWVGNVPGDSNHPELWRFFTSRSGPIGPGSSTGVESIHLISRSNCAFVNYASQAHLDHAIRTCHGVSLRPGDARCKELVCRVRRKDDDAKSGVGAQRGKGMHQAYVKEQEASMQHHYGGLPGVPPTLPGVSGHTRSPSSNEPLTPTSKDSSVNEANHSVSTTSTTSSFLSRHFRKRFFILKSHTEDDLRLSRERGLWATQPHNEIVLDQAFRTAADGVFLIFSANKSGEFFGYARMTGPIFITPDDALRAASGSGSTSLRAIPEDRTASANNLGAVPFAASPKPISGTNSPAVATAAQPSFLASRGASDPTPGRPPLEEPGARDSAPSAVPASVLTAWNQLSLGSTKSNGAKPDEDGITRRDTALTAEERNARLEELAEADDDAGSMAAAAQIQRASAPSVSVEAPPGDASEEKKTIAAGGQQGSQSSFGPGWGRPFQLEWVTTQRLPFSRTRHLRNGFNGNREVRVARDGTEIEPTCGENVLREFGRINFTSPPSSAYGSPKPITAPRFA